MMMLWLLLLCLIGFPGVASAATYYVSNSGCSDANPGTSSGAPLCTFTPLNAIANAGSGFPTGTTINLARGSTWNQELQLRGNGASLTTPNVVQEYGSTALARPKIIRTQAQSQRGVRLTNPSYWTVRDIEVGNSGTGILVRCPAGGCTGLRFLNLYLHHIYGWGEDNRDAAAIADDIYRPAGLSFSWSHFSFSPSYTYTDILIEDVEGTRNQHSISAHAYTDGLVMNRVYFHDDDANGTGNNTTVTCHTSAFMTTTIRMIIMNSVFDRPAACAAPNGTSGIFQGGANATPGTRDSVIINSIIQNTPNTNSYDQSGPTVEAYSDNLQYYNSLYRNQAGPGIAFLLLSGRAGDYQTNHKVYGNTYINNNVVPNKNGGARGHIIGHSQTGQQVGPVTVQDNLYLTDASVPLTAQSTQLWTLTNNRGIAAAADIFYASDGYSGTMGPTGWRYQYSDNGIAWADMQFVAGSGTPVSPGTWTKPGASVPSVGRFEQTPGLTATALAARVWVAPKSGTVSIRARAIKSQTTGDGVRWYIKRGDNTTLASGTLSATDRVGANTALDNVSVTANDATNGVLRFVLDTGSSGSNTGDLTSWVPSIAYTASTPGGTPAPDSQEEVCTQSWVIFCDNFEARAVGTGDFTRAIYKSPGFSGNYKWSIESGTGQDGGRAARLDCAAHGPGQPPDPGDSVNGCGGYMALAHTQSASVRTLYWRQWIKYSSNWKHSSTFQKNIISHYANAQNQTEGIYNWHMNAGGNLYTAVQSVSGYFQNVGVGVSLAVDRWYCLEAMETLSSSSTATDGALKMWVDGTLVQDHANIRTTFYNNVNWRETLFSGYYNCLTANCQGTADAHPAMHQLRDRLVIGTQQIGCGGTGGGGGGTTSPPPPPTGGTTLLPIAPSGTLATTSTVTLTWQSVTGASSYAVRLADQTDPTVPAEAGNNCTATGVQVCVNFMPGTSITVPVIEGHTYLWWVHWISSTNVFSAAEGTTITIAAAPPDEPDPPDPQDLPLTWYRFDEAAGDALDSGTSGNVGTFLGDATRTTSGKVGSALTLDGTGDFVQSTVINLPGTSVPYTVAWFAKQASVPATGSHHMVAMYRNNGGFPGFFCGFVDGTFKCVSLALTYGSVAAPSNGTFHHYALTFNGTSTWKLYLDGSLVDTQTVTPVDGVPDRLIIGCSGPSGADCFTGQVDELQVYNFEMTLAQVAGLAGAASPTGAISIQRVASNDSLSATPAPITSGSVDAIAPSTSNPALFSGLAAGTYTAKATDIAGFTVTKGTCSYAVGAAACDVTSWPTSPTCSGGICSTSVTVVADTVTLAEFKYTAIAPTGAPSGLGTLQIATTENVRLTWTDGSTNEDSFLIERKTGAGAYAQIATTTAGVTSYLDQTAVAGNTYTYKVRAENSCALPTGCQRSSYSNESAIAVTDPDDTAPPVVSSVDPTTALRDATTAITITGTDFVQGAVVTIAGTGCSITNTLVVSSTTITFSLVCTSAATLSARNLTVTHPDTDADTLAGAITIGAAAYNLYSQSYTFTWAGGTATSFSIRCGTASGIYTKNYAAPYATTVSVPLSSICMAGSGTRYIRTYPVYGRTEGTPNAEVTIEVIDDLPTDAPSAGTIQ